MDATASASESDMASWVSGVQHVACIAILLAPPTSFPLTPNFSYGVHDHQYLRIAAICTGLRRFASGALSGTATGALLQPLDVIRTHAQGAVFRGESPR